MRALTGLLLLLAAAGAGCTPNVDLKTALQVDDVSSGWYDAGIVNGQNKLVPSVTFKLNNRSTESLPVLQVNALFKRVTENDEWGNGFLTVTGSEGLAAGKATDALTIKSQLGYTGSEQSREDMLRNSQFVDAKVQLFAKYGSSQWALIGEFPITRRLIAK